MVSLWLTGLGRTQPKGQEFDDMSRFSGDVMRKSSGAELDEKLQNRLRAGPLRQVSNNPGLSAQHFTFRER